MLHFNPTYEYEGLGENSLVIHNHLMNFQFKQE